MNGGSKDQEFYATKGSVTDPNYFGPLESFLKEIISSDRLVPGKSSVFLGSCAVISAEEQKKVLGAKKYTPIDWQIIEAVLIEKNPHETSIEKGKDYILIHNCDGVGGVFIGVKEKLLFKDQESPAQSIFEHLIFEKGRLRDADTGLFNGPQMIIDAAELRANFGEDYRKIGFRVFQKGLKSTLIKHEPKVWIKHGRDYRLILNCDGKGGLFIGVAPYLLPAPRNADRSRLCATPRAYQPVA